MYDFWGFGFEECGGENERDKERKKDKEIEINEEEEWGYSMNWMSGVGGPI